MKSFPRFLSFDIFVLLLLLHDTLANRFWRQQKSKYYRPRFTKTPAPKRFLKSESVESLIEPRIVGGRPARFGEAPYHLRLMQRGEFQCGAALLQHRDLRFAITSAHCLWEGVTKNGTHLYTPKEHIQLVGADLDLSKTSPREQWFGVKEIRIHEEFDPRWNYADVALLFMDRYVWENFGLEHVELPGAGWKDPMFGTITGHGAKFRLDVVPELQIVELEVVPRPICDDFLFHWNPTHPKLQLGPEVFCVGHPIDWIRKATCGGDSGGPVVSYNYSNHKWYLAGTVGWSPLAGCGAAGSVTVLQKMSFWAKWIFIQADDYLKTHGTGGPGKK